MINPDILEGVPTWPRKSLEDQKVIDQIWELECMELDHERLVIKGQWRNSYQKTPEIDCHTKWGMKLKCFLQHQRNPTKQAQMKQPGAYPSCICRHKMVMQGGEFSQLQQKRSL